MILCEYKNKRYTLETLNEYVIDNDYYDKYVDVVLLHLLPLKSFLRECLINNYEIDSIEIIKDENKDRYKLGFKFKNITAIELIEKYQYLLTDDYCIFLSDTYSYPKDVFNYDKDKIPYINPVKFE